MPITARDIRMTTGIKSDTKFYSEEDVIKIINDYVNPYPQDIFTWDSKKKCEFNRGRFNQHCFEIVENVRNDLIKGIKEDD